MLTGQNGILNRAGEAKEKNGIAQKEEALKISVMDALSNGLGEITDSNLKKALNNNLGTEGEDYEIVGSEESGWTVTIKENEKDYKISSKGEIGEIEKVEGSKSDWEVEGNAVVKYLGKSNDIVIPNYVDGVKITEIGEKIFYNSDKTGTLKISEGIKTIDTYAFANSKFTGELILPKTIKVIKDYAFPGCSNFFGNLEIPSSVETIGNWAFAAWNGNMNNLIIPGTIKEFGDYAFVNSKGFKGKLVLKNGIKSIGRDAFLECSSLTGDLIVPDSVEVIGDSAFMVCTGFNGKLVWPSTLKKIENSAFYGCSSLTGDLIIPENAEIGSQSFSYIQTDGTLYMGKNMENIGWSTPINAKKLIINTPIKAYALMQFFTKIESCWLSSDTIKGIEENAMFSIENCIKNKNMVIYSEATEENENWPENWNPFNLKVVYGVSLEEYRKLTN